MAARRAHASGTGLSTARRARCGAEDAADLALNVLAIVAPTDGANPTTAAINAATTTSTPAHSTVSWPRSARRP